MYRMLDNVRENLNKHFYEQKRSALFLPYNPKGNKEYIDYYIEESINKSLQKICLTRQIFMVDPLPQGALSQYNIDLGNKYINYANFTIQEAIDSVFVGEIKIEESNIVEHEDIYNKVYNHIDNLFNKIADREETMLYNILDKCGEENEQQWLYDIDYLAENFIKILMTQSFLDVGDYPIFSINSKDICLFTEQLQKEEKFYPGYTWDWELGIIGKLYRSLFLASPNIPRGKIYITKSPEYCGIIPIRSEISVITNNNKEKAVATELIGMLMTDINSVRIIGWD